MAGLWERVTEGAEDNVHTHLIVAGLKAYFVNTQDATKGATRVQVRDHLNAKLTEENKPVLTSAEETDLNGIADTMDALPNVNAQQTYLFGIEYAMIAASAGVIDETKWRGDLGI